MEFIKKEDIQKQQKAKTEVAIFAGGCFWGVEYYFQNAPGVVKTEVDYIGGHKENHTYKAVCAHTTGHIEAMEVTFDTTKTNYETLAKLFFEIHDPTQSNGQGGDIGEQYLSVVFYTSEQQKEITEKLIRLLENKGYKIATTYVQQQNFGLQRLITNNIMKKREVYLIVMLDDKDFNN